MQLGPTTAQRPNMLRPAATLHWTLRRVALFLEMAESGSDKQKISKKHSLDLRSSPAEDEKDEEDEEDEEEEEDRRLFTTLWK